MTALLCCRPRVMGAALSQEGGACDAAGMPVAPPTMADVIRERKKKAGGAALGTLRRRLAAAARRPRDQRPDRGCEHARFIRNVVSTWRLAEVFALCAELEAGAALRDLAARAELARPPAAALHADLHALRETRWWCDVELVGAGWSVPAHRAILAARSTYFRHLLPRYPSARRIPLDAGAASLSRDQLQAALVALYGGHAALAHRAPPLCDTCTKWERSGGGSSDVDLDIISTETTRTNSWGHGGGSGRARCRCGRARLDAAAARRVTEHLGVSADTLHQDMKYLLDSGEYADARLSFRGASGVASGGELPCHRAILAARSRLFRKVMSSRGGGGGGGGGGVICIDEKVLPRRFARALLHAAYTDQVDLSLIGRGPPSPSAASGAAGNTSWPGVARGGGGGGGGGAARSSAACAQLDDAFQLYEIARFMEMPILAQGCEDAIVSLLAPGTLGKVLRWADAPHASTWVHRQAMRYLLDEFPAVMSSAWGCRLPRSSLAAALRSPSLQASELQALRAVVRWGEADAAQQREPNVVWHTAHSVTRRGGGGGGGGAGRRRSVSDASVRQAIADLVELVRVEHIPPDSDVLQQAIRRGLIPHPPAHMVEAGSRADAWLGRGPHRPPRCFLPYLDEIKALLEDQAVPETELARVRRTRYINRIPDTLYMVAAERSGASSGVGGGGGGAGGGGGGGVAESACVSPRTLRTLRARQRELRAAPTSLTALALPTIDRDEVYRQLALRCVREMSLPDSCADLLLADADADELTDREGSWSECDDVTQRDASADRREHCCRAGAASAHSALGSLRSVHSADQRHAAASAAEGGVGACRRRELPALVAEGGACRMVEGAGVAGGGGALYSVLPSRSLPDAVPDVALAPNGNTHLLCQPPPHNFSGMGVLQLDLGDGATHTPRPGSRALRAATQSARLHRDHVQLSRGRPPADEDDLRAAIELSVIRACSSYAPARPLSPAPRVPPPPDRTHTLPHREPRDCRLARHPPPSHTGMRGRVSSAGAGAGPGAHLSLSLARGEDHDFRAALHSALEGGGGGAGGGSGAGAASTAPRRRYRLDPSYGGSAHSSRGPSPNNYA